MESDQYEELCRHFIAEKEGLDLDAVKSEVIAGAQKPGSPEHKHQMDLRWETGGEIATYLNIANAKWRSKTKVNQGEVLQLQQVRQTVSAHRAFLITNIGFTKGAKAVAESNGIALHIVAPEFDASELPVGDRDGTRRELQQISLSSSHPIYSHRVEHRGLGFHAEPQAASPDHRQPSMSRPGGYETRIQSPPAKGTSSPPTNRAIGRGGAERRGGQNRGPGRPGTSRGRKG